MTEENQPVHYGSIKHNYEHYSKTKPRLSDNSMAMGGIVLAVIVTFLTVLALVVSL
jgi:hypothetical protein